MNEFDVVVWGATGFTGALVAEYLTAGYRSPDEPGDEETQSQAPLRWALAGRNPAKLEQLANRLGTKVPLLTADSEDPDSLRELVAQTKVVLSTVGPYAQYGSPLVKACAESGTHYCDLTGEVQWMRRMIDAHSEAARESGARLVPTCGFDSIPSDLGVLFVHNAMQEATGESCEFVKYRAADFQGGFSGGTIASLLNVMAEAERDSDLQALLADPYALDPPNGKRGLDGPDITGPQFDADFDSYIAPFVMAGINTRVVRRSNALMNYRYGREFRYDEATLMGPGPAGFAKALSFSAGMGAMLGAASFSPLRDLLGRLLPKPGDGPSATQRSNGFFRIELLARAQASTQQRVRAEVEGDLDPGYGSTAKMLAECAVCLAQDDLDLPGGFWTPASAMGERLIERLQANAGLTFTLHETP